MCKAGPGRPQEVKCLSVSEKSGLASKPGVSAYSGLCASTQLCASTPWQLSLSQSYEAEAFIPTSPQGLPAGGTWPHVTLITTWEEQREGQRRKDRADLI